MNTLPAYQWLALLTVLYGVTLGWRKGFSLAVAVVMVFVIVRV